MTVPKRLLRLSIVFLVVSFVTAVADSWIFRWGLFDHDWVLTAIAWLSRTTLWLGVVAAAGLVLVWLGDHQAERSAGELPASDDR